MSDREPAWPSDDEEYLYGDDGVDDDEMESPPLHMSSTVFVGLADSSMNSSVLTDVMGSDDEGNSPVDYEISTRMFRLSPPTVPVKRERDPSPILAGEGMVAAAIAAIDVDLQPTCRGPISLDAGIHAAHGMLDAIPVTTTQIFGTRGQFSKKQRDSPGKVCSDNSDALSSVSSSSGVSARTNASCASTISAGSCYGFVPYMHPTIAFQLPMSAMWRCTECNIIHPADYKGCGKCCKKREDVQESPGQLPLGDSTLSQLRQQVAPTVGWYPNQLSPTYSHNVTSTASGKQPGAGRINSKLSRSLDSQNTSRRGENVKGNPEMQKTAREGQKHWHEKVQQVVALLNCINI